MTDSQLDSEDRSEARVEGSTDSSGKLGGATIWRQVVDALALVAAATALGLPLVGRLEATNLVMDYLVAVR